MILSMTGTDQPKQKTPKGEEIPIARRVDFSRNLKKAAKLVTRKRPPKK
jgi:hypothetical protein